MLDIDYQTAIAVTTKELHGHILNWRRRNPQIDDLAVAVEMAIAETWPGYAPADVCLQAEINSLAFERTKEIKAAAQDLDKWVDTQAQGDLFNPLPFSVPETMLLNGMPAKYYEMTVVQMAEYLEARARSTKEQAEALQTAADAKRETMERMLASLAQVQKVIALATERGIDPAGLYCAKTV